MKILIDRQMKEVEMFTVENELINPQLLIEKVSLSIANWVSKNISHNQSLLFIIGRDEKGAIGLAVAGMMHKAGYDCTVYPIFDAKVMSYNCSLNYHRLPSDIKYLKDIDEITIRNYVIIDAICKAFVDGGAKDPELSLIETVNTLSNKVISLDLPSGMRSEFGNNTLTSIIHADITVCFLFPRLALLLPEAGDCGGQIVLLNGKSDHQVLDKVQSPYFYLTDDFIKKIRKPRQKFAHKNTYGHALLICGSQSKMGAAILAVGGALRSGCGLVTLHLPHTERLAAQLTFPSAMLSLDNGTSFSELPDNLSNYSVVGIGCGIGQSEETVEALELLLSIVRQPMLIDADALNILSEHRSLFKYIPKGSVLTPHLGELKRLVGEWRDEQHKLELASELAKQLQSVVIVKGAHTMICTPEGQFYFNSTGNSGMAKGGSGDVLAGYITGLMARGYSSVYAAILGVYNHGLAGDLAATQLGEEAMNSRNLIDFLG